MSNNVATFEKFVKSLKRVANAVSKNDLGEPLLDLENQSQLSNQFYYTLDLVEMKIIQIIASFWQLLGYEKQEITGAFIFSIIHPDDRELALSISVKALELASKLDFMIPGEDVFVVDLRLKHIDGHYLRFIRQLGVNKLNENKRPLQAFALWTDITAIKKSTLQEFSYQGPNKKYFNDLFSLTDKIGPFTQRELDVLRLISDGFATKAIANKLSISAETVNSHKKNIKKKTGIQNTTQLLRYCIDHGIV